MKLPGDDQKTLGTDPSSIQRVTDIHRFVDGINHRLGDNWFDARITTQSITKLILDSCRTLEQIRTGAKGDAGAVGEILQTVLDGTFYIGPSCIRKFTPQCRVGDGDDQIDIRRPDLISRVFRLPNADKQIE